MTQYTKVQFENLYNNASANAFADNTVGDIGANDVRQFAEDISDSFLSISDNFVDEDNMASDSATKAPSQQSVKAYVTGIQDLYIPATAMWPTTTDGCAPLAQSEISTSLLNIQTLDFDSSTDEKAQFTFSLPRNWNLGTITAKLYWTAASGTGDVIWTIKAGAYSNDDALTAALGTAQSVTDTFIAANDVHITSETAAITVAGTPASADFIGIEITRDADNGSDTFTADAKLLAVVISITTSSPKAA